MNIIVTVCGSLAVHDANWIRRTIEARVLGSRVQVISGSRVGCAVGPTEYKETPAVGETRTPAPEWEGQEA